MPDDKRGRDKKARDAERRQRKREIADELERGDEPEPPIDVTELATVEAELEPLAFPATGEEIITAIGSHEIESPDGTYRIKELVPETDEETFESPTAVRKQVQRPTVAAAMKQVIEATETVSNVTLGNSQRNAYEKTFRALKAIDADDDDEGIQVISDWIVEQISSKEKLPESRSVRRRAAKFCRSHGYQIQNDEWLGV